MSTACMRNSAHKLNTLSQLSQPNKYISWRATYNIDKYLNIKQCRVNTRT